MLCIRDRAQWIPRGRICVTTSLSRTDASRSAEGSNRVLGQDRVASLPAIAATAWWDLELGRVADHWLSRNELITASRSRRPPRPGSLTAVTPSNTPGRTRTDSAIRL